MPRDDELVMNLRFDPDGLALLEKIAASLEDLEGRLAAVEERHRAEDAKRANLEAAWNEAMLKEQSGTLELRQPPVAIALKDLIEAEWIEAEHEGRPPRGAVELVRAIGAPEPLDPTGRIALARQAAAVRCCEACGATAAERRMCGLCSNAEELPQPVLNADGALECPKDAEGRYVDCAMGPFRLGATGQAAEVAQKIAALPPVGGPPPLVYEHGYRMTFDPPAVSSAEGALEFTPEQAKAIQDRLLDTFLYGMEERPGPVGGKSLFDTMGVPAAALGPVEELSVEKCEVCHTRGPCTWEERPGLGGRWVCAGCQR